jgi:hypothetical protein
MGKRTRRRFRQDASAEADGPDEALSHQAMARVNVDLETWTAFRVEALRTQTSVASYLGTLVCREVARTRRRDQASSTTL